MLSATPAGSAQSLGGLVLFLKSKKTSLPYVEVDSVHDSDARWISSSLTERPHRSQTDTAHPAGREKKRAPVRRRVPVRGRGRVVEIFPRKQTICTLVCTVTQRYRTLRRHAQQEHSNVKPFQAKLIRSQWVSAVGGIPSLPHPLGTPARCPSTSCFLTDHNQRRPRPHLSPPLPRSQHAAISSE